MDLELTLEQRAVVETTRAFVQRELVPYEDEVERSGVLDPGLLRTLRDTAIRAGLYAANMPEDVGGGGLDTLTWMLMERELGHTGYALQMLAVARPSRILLACEGDQRESYLRPVVAGERTECLAMTEPEAGSDLRGMRTRAVRDGADWLVTGTKHFISHADAADFVILFAATGEQAPGADAPRRAEITAFLVDTDTPGLTVLPGYRSVSHRGYEQLGTGLRRLPGAGVGGAGRGRVRLRRGHHLAGHDPPAGRRELPGPGAPRARPGRPPCGDPAPVRPAHRAQPGSGVQARRHGHGAGVRDVADLARGLARRRRRRPGGRPGDRDGQARRDRDARKVADEALQIHGGMGLMDELVLERIWRDARVERIWDGTSEIQRHIVSRSMLRAHGG